MSTAPAHGTRRVYRSPSGVIGLAVAAVVALFLLGDATIKAGWGQTALLAPWLLLMLWAAYVVLWAPSVVTDLQGVTVQNMLRRVRMPWHRITEIDLQWQTVFRLDNGRTVRAHGGPVAGRPGRLGSGSGRREPPAVRDVELIRSDWENRREDTDSGEQVRREWDVPALVALAIIVVWAGVAIWVVGQN